MPIALFIFGVLFLVVAVRGPEPTKDLFALLKDDFTGPGNFIYWGLSLWVIGAVGYYKPLRPISHAFMFLVILVLFLSNRGFFNRFMEQLGSGEAVGSNWAFERDRSGGSIGDIGRGIIGPVDPGFWK
jgi:hypothetical protein